LQPKQFWKNIKSQYKTDSKEKINISIESLFTHFNNLHGNEATTDISSRFNINFVYDNELDAVFPELEVKNAVFAQNNSKSPGPDNLIAEGFKHLFDIISPFIVKLYNEIFTHGMFPESWTQGINVPI
jgi:hypothetical protein